MKKSRMLAAVAVAAVLGILITTTTTIGSGIFVQQANAASCLILEFQGQVLCSDPSGTFNYGGMTNPGQPYLYKELPQPLPTTQPPIVIGTPP